MSIFIGIPSYCDPVLGFTMTQAYEKAKFPDDVYFGVVDQSPLNTPSLIPAHIPASQIAAIRVDSSQARGCSWARNLVGSLYADQDWYLQLDSHMMFDQDWDATLVRQIEVCQNLQGYYSVVSSYPEGFRFIDGKPVAKSGRNRLLANALRADLTEFNDKNPLLFFSPRELADVGAVEGFHISGGCLFAPGEYAVQIPADPYLYFNEEEQNLSLRLYTNGWSIFHVRGNPIYHLYTQPVSGVKRELHWDKKEETPAVKPLWMTYDKRSKKRLATLLWGDDSDLGVYGLGTERTLEDFAQVTGIDYPNRRIEPRAHDGPWGVPVVPPVKEAV